MTPSTLFPEETDATQPASQQAQAFGDTLITLYNHAAVTLMISLGHKLRLFDVLAQTGPVTSAELANAAGLNERYVREWLAALVTGGILEYAPETQQYQLPAPHAACLTRDATPNNLATLAQHIPVIASVESEIAECFRTGKGLDYHAYPCFHQVMAEDSEQTVVAALFDHILPLAPGLHERLVQGIEVLDAGCGAGKALLQLARAYPDSRFTGYDLSSHAFAESATAAKREGLTNLHFEARDLTGFDEPGRYDLVTSFDAVHDQGDPAGLLKGIARALRPDGLYLMQDIAGSSHLHNNLAHPVAPLLYSISCLHCTPVSLAQGGPGLGTLWGEELAQTMLKEAGFRHVEIRRLQHDPVNAYFLARP